MDPRVTDDDRILMRDLQIGTEPDLRTHEQSEERLMIPEWIRRAQWRHFWEEQDAAHALLEQERAREPEFTKRREVPTPLHAFRSQMSNTEPDNARSWRNTPACDAKGYAITVLLAVVIVLCILLGVYLST